MEPFQVGEKILAFYSKMGAFKKEKIEKPDYEAIISNADVKSDYVKKIESITELFLIKIRAKDSLKEVSKNIFLSKWANGFFSNTQIS